MNISHRMPKTLNRSELPALPEIKPGSGPQIFEIPYLSPDTVEIELGRIPANMVSETKMINLGRLFRKGETEAWPGAAQSVKRVVPRANPDGTVKMKDATKTLEVNPQSKTSKALAWGVAGSVLGGVAGFALGTMVGLPLVGAAVGVGLVGGTTSVIGAKQASQQRVRLAWKQMPIVSYRLDGFNHTSVELSHRDLDTDQEVADGFLNTFTPAVSTTFHGHYFEPVVVTFHKDDPTRGERQLKPSFQFRR